VSIETLRVALGERSYDIRFGAGAVAGEGGGEEFARSLAAFGFSPRSALITNPTVHALYGAGVERAMRAAGLDPVVVTVPDGEGYKTWDWLGTIVTELLRARLDRGSAIVALGGGVIGDMAGFAAAIYMRGIRFVQVPTTLLAQVDSSVGGKTGVNHPFGKNLIGAFWQPSLVWTDVLTLATLPRREFLAGMAEVIKYGAIWDATFFEYLRTRREEILALSPEPLTRIVRRSCEIKAEVVGRDEREGGIRAVLNYGHTIGHAVESATGYTRYLHGEGVAVGMCAEADLAVRMGVCGEDAAARIRELCRLYELPVSVPDVSAEALLEAMALDKKTLRGELRFVLPEGIGRARVGVAVPRAEVEQLLGVART
jgi:3-dehydroquinate synthase